MCWADIERRSTSVAVAAALPEGCDGELVAAAPNFDCEKPPLAGGNAEGNLEPPTAAAGNLVPPTAAALNEAAAGGADGAVEGTG